MQWHLHRFFRRAYSFMMGLSCALNTCLMGVKSTH